MGHVIKIDLPESSIVTGQIVVLAFIGEDGVERWDTRVGTDMTQSQIIGLLEMAKHAYMTRSQDE